MLMAALLLLPAWLSRADVHQQDANAAWHQADQCARDAAKKFPDHTREANVEREAARIQCLRNHKLPAPTAAGTPTVPRETEEPQ